MVQAWPSKDMRPRFPMNRRIDRLLLRGLYPVSHEDVGLAGLLLIPIRGERQPGSIRGEHWKTVETRAEGDPLEIAPIDVDRPDDLTLVSKILAERSKAEKPS